MLPAEPPCSPEGGSKHLVLPPQCQQEARSGCLTHWRLERQASSRPRSGRSGRPCETGWWRTMRASGTRCWRPSFPRCAAGGGQGSGVPACQPLQAVRTSARVHSAQLARVHGRLRQRLWRMTRPRAEMGAELSPQDRKHVLQLMSSPLPLRAPCASSCLRGHGVHVSCCVLWLMYASQPPSTVPLGLADLRACPRRHGARLAGRRTGKGCPASQRPGAICAPHCSARSTSGPRRTMPPGWTALWSSCRSSTRA